VGQNKDGAVKRENFLYIGMDLHKKTNQPIFYEYYQRKINEGKTKTQALVCIMRRLVNIIFGMMKTKRVPPVHYKGIRTKL